MKLRFHAFKKAYLKQRLDIAVTYYISTLQKDFFVAIDILLIRT